MTVYTGKQVQVIITETAEGDMGSFVAQEVTLEPRHAIEGIDALNSDEVQAWGDGLVTYEGTLKEAFKAGADGKKILERSSPFQTSLKEYTMKLIWDGGAGKKITITLTGVIFPEPSISSPKNAPSMITTRFRAKSATVAIA
ncbi:MAG: hypothetical protein ACE5NN_01065 [Candidatus Bathyarchaeia archaeon]